MFVYLVESQNSLCKIGITEDVARRFKELRNYSPVSLVLCAIIEIDTAETIEKELHERFQTNWHHGEWFDVPISTAIAEFMLRGGTTDIGEISWSSRQRILPTKVDQAIELLKANPEWATDKWTTRALQDRTGLDKDVWSKAKRRHNGANNHHWGE